LKLLRHISVECQYRPAKNGSHLSLYRNPTQLRNTSRMNIFVMLLMLFMVSGHCSAAMAIAPSMAVVESPSVGLTAADHHQGHCGDVTPETSHHSDAGSSCFDGHCTDSITSLQAQSFKQVKDKQDDAQLLVAAIFSLPPSRDGPCHITPSLHAPDFVTPPLYYSLCVLRL
jgi:hypothetical protein